MEALSPNFHKGTYKKHVKFQQKEMDGLRRQ